MKKFFLPLLAVLGMTVGLTLTSCGGGGGKSAQDEPARALAGCSITTINSTPNFTVEFNTASTGWTVASDFIPGDSREFPCYFTLIREPELADGYWEFWGSMGWVSTDICEDNQFLALIGVNQGADSCALESFSLRLVVPAGKQDGTYSGTGQMTVAGRYFMGEGEAEGTKLTEEPIEIQFEMTGVLKEEFLKGGTSEDPNSTIGNGVLDTDF